MKNRVRFSPNLRRWFYGIFGLLFFSGVAWLVTHYLMGQNEEFGGENNAVGPWLLKIHGAAAMASLLVLGVLGVFSVLRIAFANVPGID